MTNKGEVVDERPDQARKNLSLRVPSKFRATAQVASIVLIFLLLWGYLYVQIGDAVKPPQGQLFSMTILVVAAYLIGWVFYKVTTLPALIGMLATGLLFRNVVPAMCQWDETHKNVNRDLRKISLVIILTRAGLGLDAAVLKKHYAAVLQLGLLPWIVECVMIAITTGYLLYLPWVWAFLLGSMIASVSPAVVVPCLFRLREKGYGVAKGIPTIILAACAIDDSISVAIFSIILNAIFSDGSLAYNIIKGPISIIAGIAFGFFFGALTTIIPERGDTYVVPIRFLMLFTSGVFALFMSNFIGWSGAGPLAVVSSGFVASFLWSKQGWPVNNNPVSHLYRILWIFFEPILFAFTGAQIVITMPFKIIETIEKGQKQLCIIPSAWESQNVLRWPRKRIDQKLAKDINSRPAKNWSYSKCTVKRLSIGSYKEAITELDVMVENSDTEAEETRTEILIPKKATDFNALAGQLIYDLDTRVVYMGAICLVSCLVIRMVATFIVSSGCGLNSKEKLFIGFTWMAKATVQAALGPAALDLIRRTANPDPDPILIGYGKVLLAISVLSVVISAPLGALLIAITGPALLSRSSGDENGQNALSVLQNEVAVENAAKTGDLPGSANK